MSQREDGHPRGRLVQGARGPAAPGDLEGASPAAPLRAADSPANSYHGLPDSSCNRMAIFKLSKATRGNCNCHAGLARDATNGKQLATLSGHMDDVWGAAFSPDSETLATASWDGTVKLWHVATGQELLSLKGSPGLAESMAWCVAFAPDGQTLAGGFSNRGGRGGEVILWHGASRGASASSKP